MKKISFLMLIIFQTLIYSQQFDQYSTHIQSIERYDDGLLLNQFRKDSPIGNDNSFVGKKGTYQTRNTFRGLYTWVHNIPEESNITSGTLYIKFTITSEKLSPNDYVKLIIKKFPNSKFSAGAEEQWTQINGATTLHTTDQIYKNTQYGTLTIPLTQDMINYLEGDLSTGRFHFAFRAVDEGTWGTNLNLNYLNLKINPSIGVQEAVRLVLNYEEPSGVSFNVTNNFLANNGTEGEIRVSQINQTAPFPLETMVGEIVTIEAISPQTDNQGIQRIWHTGSTTPSEWDRNGTRKSYNRIYTFEVVADDDNKKYTANLRQNRTTASGTISQNETWINNVTLTGNVTVGSGVTLTIAQEGGVNLNGKYIKCSGSGKIIKSGSVSGTKHFAKQGTYYKAFFPPSYSDVQTPINLCSSGWDLHIAAGSYNAPAYSMKSGVNVIGAGVNSTTLSRVVFYNDDGAGLSDVKVNNEISINYSDNVDIEDVTAGHSNCYIDLANSSNLFMSNFNSEVYRALGVYAHSGSDFFAYVGTLKNKNNGIQIEDNSDAEVWFIDFCSNSSDDIISFYSTVHAYSCIFTGTTPGSSVSGNVSYFPWISCNGGGGGVLHKQAGLTEISAASDDRVLEEYTKIKSDYKAVKEKIKEDKKFDKIEAIDKNKTDLETILKDYQKFVKKYPESKLTPTALGRIADILRLLGNYDELFSYMNSIAADKKTSHLKPFALGSFPAMYIKMGEYQKAIEQFDALIQEFPEHLLAVEWIYGKGLLYKYQLENNVKAADMFNLVVSNYSEHTTAQSAKEELEFMGQAYLAKEPNEVEILNGFRISNYPNPFNPSTTIRYSLPKTSNISLVIYDMMGREVRSYEMNGLSVGNHSQVWDGTNNNGARVSSGIYIYRFKAVSIEGDGASFEKSAKLILMK